MKSGRIKIITALCVAAAATVLLGPRLVNFALDREAFKSRMASLGPLAPLAFVALVACQIIFAFIPGEPLEIARGYAFGAGAGTALCLAGCLIGSAAAFLAVKKLGVKKTPVLSGEGGKLRFIAVFRLPGTPKDALCWRAPMTGIKMRDWLALSTIARIPSVASSAISGSFARQGNRPACVAVLAATGLVSLAGLWVYRRKKLSEVKKERENELY